MSPSTAESLDWVVGVYSREDSETLDRDYTYLEAPFSSVNDTDTLAIYGQVSQAVSEDVTLTLGARYEQRDVTYRDSAGVQEKFDDNYWTGNASINWQASETGAFFVTVARGVRAGGVNASLSSTLVTLANEIDVTPYRKSTRFDEEVLLSTEIGYRFSSADQRISGSVTLFNMDRSDQQVRALSSSLEAMAAPRLPISQTTLRAVQIEVLRHPSTGAPLRHSVLAASLQGSTLRLIATSISMVPTCQAATSRKPLQTNTA